MGMANGNQQDKGNNQQSSMASNGGAPTGADAEDITGDGGGNIGIGGVPTPGEDSFSAGVDEDEGAD